MTKEDKEESQMVRDTGKLSVLTFASRVLGLVREMTKARFLGTGPLSDAFTVSFVIPNLMRRLFAEGSIAVAFIPTFKGYLHEDKDDATRRFLSSSLTVLTILVGSIVALGIALTPEIVKAFGTNQTETTILTRIMFPFLALVSLAALFQGILNSYGIFTPSGIAPILFNLCFIAVPWLVSNLAGNPARAMAIGVVVGGAAQAFCQLPAVLKTGIRFGYINPFIAFRDPGMRKVFLLIAPTILGMAAYQVNDLVSTAFASRAGLGVASSLQFSLRLQELILGIFAVSAGTVLLPGLADSVRRQDWKNFSTRLGRTLDAVLLASIPVAVFSMIAGREIIALLFESGDFGAKSVELTYSAFFWHQAGLAFIASNRVIAPAFYAQSDTVTPTWAGIASFIVDVIIVVAVAETLKGPGIAFALSFSSLVNTAILVWRLRRSGIERMNHELSGSALYALKLLFFSVIAGAPIFLLRRPLDSFFSRYGSRFVSAGAPLVLMTLVFGAIGIVLLAISKDRVAGSIVNAVKRRAHRQ
jgi:putative peptidoglycan lipid II flippase